MRELAGQQPRNLDRSVIEPLSEITSTLREHYRRKQARYQVDTELSFDRPLLRVFARPEERPRGRLASSLLREMRPQLRRLLVRRARMHPYVVSHVMRVAARRARVLGLRVRGGPHQAQRDALVLHERIMLEMLVRDRENFAL
jgi:hypothetical protein